MTTEAKAISFDLKEMSHELFRNSDDASYKEKLYDITIGYIFHEAMKLRENMYQLEYYRPQCDIALHTLTDQEKKIVHEIGLLVNKAEVRLKEGFKEIKVLLNELVGQLKDLIVLYQNNYLLPRFIFENERSLKKIYGKKGFANPLEYDILRRKTTFYFKGCTELPRKRILRYGTLLFKKVLRLDSQKYYRHYFCLPILRHILFTLKTCLRGRLCLRKELMRLTLMKTLKHLYGFTEKTYYNPFKRNKAKKIVLGRLNYDAKLESLGKRGNKRYINIPSLNNGAALRCSSSS